jgi:hypothetical protein
MRLLTGGGRMASPANARAGWVDGVWALRGCIKTTSKIFSISAQGKVNHFDFDY